MRLSMTEQPVTEGLMTSPQTGDRVVYFSGDKWASFRIGGHRTLWHGSREEAICHARRMLNDQGFGRLLVMEQGDTGEERFRIVKKHTR